jgi:hypothetical protein
MYPEGFLIYAAALAPIAGLVPIWRMIRRRRFMPRALVPALGFAGVGSVALYRPLLQHLINQVLHSAGTIVPWWTYFQAFFYGRDGHPGHVTDFWAGLFGLYFATPTAHTPFAIAMIQRGAICIVIASVVAAVVIVCRRRVEVDRELSPDSRAILVSWFAAAVLMLVPAALLFAHANYWPAGKIVSYAAPVYMMLLAVPIGYRVERRALRPLRWITITFVAFQIALGLIRIPAAARANGIHYAAPYPAVTVTRFKSDIGWDLRPLAEVLAPGQRVLLRSMDPWPEAYLMIFLYSRGTPFVKTTPVNTNFGAGRDVGTMTIGVADVEISVDNDAFVLHYRDGRGDVRVPSRRD